ncbi:phage major capsid protein [Flavobacterium sp. SLB02]|uniref:phage major capsid protein n=1 Tax=Flavobacterium sp. SLB02 TaxID=2665645 RepID=UPI0012A9F452|nr:phage major capsid protein [Flavobacterium sp. SLB02]QGK72841.1 phage major capsid protein [Flavobacterium sp. SLB02]
MKKSAEIRQELSGLVSSQQAMADVLKTEKRSAFNEAEQTKFDDLQKQIGELRTQLATAEAFEENQRSFGANPSGPSLKDDEENGGGNGGAPAPKRSFSIHKAIRSQIGNNVLSGVELDVHNATAEIAKRSGIPVQGICIPLFDTRSVQMETRADGQTVTQDSGGYGGNLVSTEVQPVIDALRPKPVVEKLGAIFLTGLQGDLKFPVNNGGIAATWEGEVDEVDPTKNAYGSKTMTPKRLAVAVPISLQNLMQSSIDLEAYTMSEIRTIVANAIDLAAINGSGTGQPMGILNASGTNAVAGGTNGLAPTFANMVALETGIFVENANGAKLNYVSNAKVRGKLKTTEITSGYPTFIMAPDGTVNGYPFETSNHVPSNLTKGTAAGVASAAIFGDFSQLIVGQWGFMDITVDNISRKKEGYIEIIVNVFVDVLVKQPKAFSVIKDLLTA